MNGSQKATSYSKTFTQNVTVYESDGTFIKGDMNRDKLVNSTDAALVLDRFKNNNATEEDFKRGDMTNDHILNSTDAALILDAFKNSNN